MSNYPKVRLDGDTVVVEDIVRGRIVTTEYRGGLPGGLACYDFAEKLLAARYRRDRKAERSAK